MSLPIGTVIVHALPSRFITGSAAASISPVARPSGNASARLDSVFASRASSVWNTLVAPPLGPGVAAAPGAGTAAGALDAGVATVGPAAAGWPARGPVHASAATDINPAPHPARVL